MAGKQTLAVKLGDQRTRFFYGFLLLITQASLVLAVSIDKQIALTLICYSIGAAAMFIGYYFD
jgi:1,4-dihydroxy-2-naphthoate octaprenyltransferase